MVARGGSSSAAPGNAGGRRLAFRPDIEGLRAAAVGMVVVLHAGVATVSGGFVGVDVFFVISGFLITSLLINETRATGSVSILGFYARRARRILPAACFVIAVTVVVAYMQLGSVVGQTTAIDGRWAAAFAANFRFIHQGTDYFATNLPPSPLQHYWSLAVEEQFYLVWPTLLFGLVILGRRVSNSTATVRLGLAAIVAGSLYWSVHLSTIAPTNAYFSPFTRAWELGAGALVAAFAVVIGEIPAVVRAVATWVGLAFVAVAAFTFTATTVFPGYAALLPVGGAVLIIAGGIGATRGAAGLVLGLPPLRWLGRISFSVYLWHWPVLVIAEERSATPLSNVARVMCVLVTLALSVASYYAIERPLHTSGLLKTSHGRNEWERARKALAFGAAAIALAVAVSAYTNDRSQAAINRVATSSSSSVKRSLSDGVTPTMSDAEVITKMQQTVRARTQAGLALHRVPADLDPPVLQIKTAVKRKYTICLQGPDEVTVKPCTFGRKASARTIVVFGDSHAMSWMPALDLFGQQAGYRVVSVYKASCPVPSAPVYRLLPSGKADHVPFAQCATWRTNAFRYIRSLRPAGLILAFNQVKTTPTGLGPLAVWRSGLQNSVRALAGLGVPIVHIGNNPYLPQSPVLCLTRHNADPSVCTGTVARPPTQRRRARGRRGRGRDVHRRRAVVLRRRAVPRHHRQADRVRERGTHLRAVRDRLGAAARCEAAGRGPALTQSNRAESGVRSHVPDAPNSSRSLCFMTLPVALRGSSATKRTTRGRL